MLLAFLTINLVILRTFVVSILKENELFHILHIINSKLGYFITHAFSAWPIYNKKICASGIKSKIITKLFVKLGALCS